MTRDQNGPPSLGLNFGVDAFTSEYTDDVGACGFFDNCTSPLQLEWRSRWAADRPTMDTTIPIVHFTGSADDFLTPGFQKCGIDRIAAQTANATFCVSTGSDHSNIVAKDAPWFRQHLANALLGESAPPACTGTDALPKPFICDLPIANLTDPGTP